MGRYTNRSRAWELWQSFVLFFFLVLLSLLTYGVFGPIVILVASNRVKYDSWAKKALILAVLHLCVLICITIYEISKDGLDLTLFKMSGSAYVFTIFMSFHLREYLERLDLKRYMHLEANVSYSYFVITENWKKREVKEVDEKMLFLAMLRDYRSKISNTDMISNLQDMERLADLIVEKNKEKSSLFFLKHHSSLDSVLKQYVELQNLPLVDVNVNRLMGKLVEVIALSKKSFEKELINMFDVEVMSMVSEADFYKNYVQSKGLI